MNRHHVKASEAADQCLAVAREMQQAPPPGYIKVAKPHISLVRTDGMWPARSLHGLWRITGVTGATLYGRSPLLAYQAWRRHIEGDILTDRRSTP